LVDVRRHGKRVIHGVLPPFSRENLHRHDRWACNPFRRQKLRAVRRLPADSAPMPPECVHRSCRTFAADGFAQC
jgi:hypothetical protein